MDHGWALEYLVLRVRLGTGNETWSLAQIHNDITWGKGVHTKVSLIFVSVGGKCNSLLAQERQLILIFVKGVAETKFPILAVRKA